MAELLNILILEDDQNDLELIKRQLIRDEIVFKVENVQDETEYLKAIDSFGPDIIISDYNMPQFSGMKALEIRNNLEKHIPFILVTGSINEEVAVECIKAGADDYVIKHNLSRLGQAVLSALKKAEIIRAKEQAEKALKETETIFSAFMEHSPVYIFFKDSQTRPIRLSRNYENMLGMPAEKALGKTMDELFPSDLSKSMILDDLKVLNENAPIRIIEELNEKVYETTKFPIISQDGSKMLAGFTVDITERIRAENELNKNRREFRNYFDLSSVGLSVSSADKKWLEVNQKLCDLLGYTKDELTGLCWPDLSHPDELGENLELFEKALKGQIDKYELDKKFIRKDGTILTINLSTVCQRNEDGSADHFLSSYVDITDRKKNEVELIYAKEKAEESDRLKTSFLHNISHEIRTPMNAIVGFSSLLASDPHLNVEQKEHADIIIRSSDHLLSIVNDIIDISNIEAGVLKVDKADVNVNKVLSNLYLQLIQIARKKDLEFKCITNKSSDETFIVTDGTKLTQVLLNLLNNALKFTKSGFIEYGYNLKEKFIEFYVFDSGVGILPEYHEKIFDRFYQAENGLTGIQDGTGLGLAISKAFVEKLGGEIWFNSQPGKGTQFYFTLPYTKPGGEISVEGIELPLKEIPGNKTILIAEDDDANYKLLTYLIGRIGVKMVRAVTGQEAVEIALSDLKIDLVLMDVKMPVMDGYEATRTIKGIKPEIPIIALTAFAFDSDREKAINAGCDDYLSKPVRKDNLVSVIRKYI